MAQRVLDEVIRRAQVSDLDGTIDQTRSRRLDLSLSKALQGMLRSSGESLSEDVTLKAREFAQRSKILRGRQMIWMIIDYFKSIDHSRSHTRAKTSKHCNGRAMRSFNGSIHARSSLFPVCLSPSPKLCFATLSCQRFAPRRSYNQTLWSSTG